MKKKEMTCKKQMASKKSVTGKYQNLAVTARGAVLSIAFALAFCMPVFAAEDGAAVVTNGFNVIVGIIAAVVSSIGTLLLLWGLFEWAIALNTQDGGAQSMAFKRIGAGIIAVLGPQLLPLITTAMGVTG